MTKAHKSPVLFVDVDGVISLFGFRARIRELPPDRSTGSTAWCIASPKPVGQRLGALSHHFEMVWATGWEERANEHLPHLLEPAVRDLPTLIFDGRARFGSAHWKLDAIDEYAGATCRLDRRLHGRGVRGLGGFPREPTMMVRTSPSPGL